MKGREGLGEGEEGKGEGRGQRGREGKRGIFRNSALVVGG